ncbi:RNA polymerase sigma-70 factor (ECF subfamily) [Hydrogenophaga palleronii]|uniref:RNA polymerase sigma-70 factor (ECF subfamily) n=1 Tax=Hydrogenophaga palleronii TaxID=65655 RepID=A0ABU1WQS8_9BURK|nr:RNA polymerase sigma factor SigJ [Hydrogenophaga palleronii]MDR7151404.1 RNA polymerase sigma-70 factor (ECF subfamily) [Hydrogenophaga palleronii]
MSHHKALRRLACMNAFDPSSNDHAQTARALRFDREHVRSLRALAYRMLGSRAEAEDIVQETWLRWAGVDEQGVDHAGAFLSRIATNLCLDRLGSAAARREQYVGVWLPDPLLDDEAQGDWAPNPETQAEFAQDVSVAFMLALERLSPLERASFLLHEVFDMDFEEIAQRLQRSAAACRQLASRARQHVKADYARHDVAKEERDRLFDLFAEAVRNRDVEALARVLTEDALMLADGGGKVSAAPRPLQGGGRIAQAFIGFANLPASQGWRLEPARVNGLPGVLVFDDLNGGRLLQTIALAPSASEPGRVGAIYIQRNPEKLQGVLAALARRPA